MTAGRPTDYNPEIAEEICNTIASSDVGIKKLCKRNPHWPGHEAIRRWVNTKPEFRGQYVDAKAAQIDWLVERAYEVATDSTNDTFTDDEGNEKCDAEWVSRCRLHVDYIKWLSSKLAPKIYGDRKEVNPGEEGQSLLHKLIDKL